MNALKPPQKNKVKSKRISVYRQEYNGLDVDIVVCLRAYAEDGTTESNCLYI